MKWVSWAVVVVVVVVQGWMQKGDASGGQERQCPSNHTDHHLREEETETDII